MTRLKSQEVQGLSIVFVEIEVGTRYIPAFNTPAQKIKVSDNHTEVVQTTA
jgi:hypothetical protein